MTRAPSLYFPSMLVHIEYWISGEKMMVTINFKIQDLGSSNNCPFVQIMEREDGNIWLNNRASIL